MIDFNKEKHEYSNKGVIYDSVTRVISKYHKEFDSRYWSTYKACKDIIILRLGDPAWGNYKRRAGGWEKVPAYYWKEGHALHKEIEVRKAQYLHAWDIKAQNARATGSAVHTWKEKAIKAKQQIVTKIGGDTVTLHVSSGQLLKAQDFDIDRIYPELMISNDQFKIAGTADRVEKVGRVVHVKDYKTSEEIKKLPFMDQRMFFPLDSLPDANYFHYQVQFSTYGWMLEQQGFKVGSLTLEHLIPPDFDEKSKKCMDIPYVPHLVVAMLQHYRGELNEPKIPQVVTSEKTFNFG